MILDPVRLKHPSKLISEKYLMKKLRLTDAEFPASLLQRRSSSAELNLLGIRVFTALLKHALLNADLLGPCLAKKTKASPEVEKLEAMSSLSSAR